MLNRNFNNNEVATIKAYQPPAEITIVASNDVVDIQRTDTPGQYITQLFAMVDNQYVAHMQCADEIGIFDNLQDCLKYATTIEV